MDIILPENQVINIGEDARGLSVFCRKGIIWLTQPGDSRDHFLKAGERFTITCMGTITVEACKEAAISLLGNAPNYEEVNLTLNPRDASGKIWLPCFDKL